MSGRSEFIHRSSHSSTGVLGVGVNGNVTFVMHDGKECALKAVQLGRESPNTFIELMIMKNVVHDHVNGTFNISSIDISNKSSTYNILQERALCCLSNMHEMLEPLDADAMRIVALNISHGVYCLHKLKIVVNDIKPSNILIFMSKQEDGEEMLVPKINDFDASLLYPGYRLYNHRGSILYFPPEKIVYNLKLTEKQRNLIGGYNFSADIYSLGLTIYYLYTGEHLFTRVTGDLIYNLKEAMEWDDDRLNLRKMFASLIPKQYKNVKKPETVHTVPADILSLIRDMTRFLPENRPNIEYVVKMLGNTFDITLDDCHIPVIENAIPIVHTTHTIKSTIHLLSNGVVRPIPEVVRRHITSTISVALSIVDTTLYEYDNIATAMIILIVGLYGCHPCYYNPDNDNGYSKITYSGATFEIAKIVANKLDYNFFTTQI